MSVIVDSGDVDAGVVLVQNGSVRRVAGIGRLDPDDGGRTRHTDGTAVETVEHLSQLGAAEGGLGFQRSGGSTAQQSNGYGPLHGLSCPVAGAAGIGILVQVSTL